MKKRIKILALCLIAVTLSHDLCVTAYAMDAPPSIDEETIDETKSAIEDAVSDIKADKAELRASVKNDISDRHEKKRQERRDRIDSFNSKTTSLKDEIEEINTARQAEIDSELAEKQSELETKKNDVVDFNTALKNHMSQKASSTATKVQDAANKAVVTHNKIQTAKGNLHKAADVVEKVKDYAPIAAVGTAAAVAATKVAKATAVVKGTKAVAKIAGARFLIKSDLRYLKRTFNRLLSSLPKIERITPKAVSADNTKKFTVAKLATDKASKANIDDDTKTISDDSVPKAGPARAVNADSNPDSELPSPVFPVVSCFALAAILSVAKKLKILL